jgi:hypothetical protein
MELANALGKERLKESKLIQNSEQGLVLRGIWSYDIMVF